MCEYFKILLKEVISCVVIQAGIMDFSQWRIRLPVFVVVRDRACSGPGS